MTLNRRTILKAAAGAFAAPGLFALSSRGSLAQARRPRTW